jgi:hypothetical protein
VALSGIAAGRPSLAFTVGAGRGALPLKTISILLSDGLRFGRTTGRLTLRGQGGRRLAFASRLVSGSLQITLAVSSWWVGVTISPVAIKTAAALAASVRRHRPSPVRLTVLTTDSSGHGAASRTRIKPRT